MHSWDFPGTLSPCLRTFLEMLCNEAIEMTAESRAFFPFEEVGTQSIAAVRFAERSMIEKCANPLCCAPFRRYAASCSRSSSDLLLRV